MNTINVSESPYSESTSSIITSLYDLMTLFDVQHSDKSRPDISPDAHGSDKHGYSNSVTERVNHMFETGQIRFRNSRDFKKYYAELFIDDELNI